MATAFSAETAAVSGRAERSIQRDAERGEKVTEEAMGLIRGTHLDTGAYLDKLKRMTQPIRFEPINMKSVSGWGD
ncbi:hypothetical protein GGR25_002263 [Kaistia hirudinis]|uniref:Uncharacterized protein n=1 Tax=Kaistia hirudinis TaxID=1293440 RepID=A0A840APL1_9HYPH|nr:hypothetical protein [Kaistia hirudinis]MBB3931213.1 hypothetical protein [Kaistia hirudinis]